MYAFHSGSYTSFLTRQCLNSVPVKPKKWYFRAHWGLWWIVNYTEIKSRKKRSKNLFSDMCIHFTDLMLTLCCPVLKLCLWKICEGVFSDLQRLVVSQETSSNEACRESSWAPALRCVNSSRRVKPFFGLNSLKSVLYGIWVRTFGFDPRTWRKKYPQGKSRRKLSVKLLCVVLMALTQLSPSFHWAVF